ncbi:branched-chain amino acid ABC transporter permease [Phreatobacter stygius]|uniref:Branched-chain amino acid ABC transporter permease n=1 Tax=Phreatobacter stygius TaxID=1940610 RepID=A0A4D7AU48_9HYPH|nr:branched-chain amino acid ABC transporter permease [Phreatobacter stygius]QCI64409.1 branched-chain amino acid ABC transporter permease [Phreatobacter stygius]
MFGISAQVLSGQLLIGLINGSFYALMSLGLAIIFGLLHIINFAHGAIYMLGAMCAWLLLAHLGIGYWWALLLSPLIVGAFGMVLDRLLISRLRNLDPIYGLLLTFGIALMMQSLFQGLFGSSGLPYGIPAELRGGWNLGFVFLPKYRAWIIVVSILICFSVWYAIEKTRLGSYLRATNEDPDLVSAFGVNVPMLVTLTFGAGAALAGFAGVLAGPIYTISPQMGVEMLSVVFAVVVIGGMGSILGSIISGFSLGILEGLTKIFYPEASSVVIFVAMIVVITIRPSGLLGKY